MPGWVGGTEATRAVPLSPVGTAQVTNPCRAGAAPSTPVEITSSPPKKKSFWLQPRLPKAAGSSGRDAGWTESFPAVNAALVGMFGEGRS